MKNSLIRTSNVPNNGPAPNFQRSNASVLRCHVQIPVDLAILTIPGLQPFVRLLEMRTIKETPARAQRARMGALQNQVLAAVDALDSLLSRLAPSQEDNTSRALRSDGIDDFLRELLPAFSSVRVGLVCAHSQAGVEKEHATLSPGSEQATVLRRRREGGVILFKALVDVLKRGRGGCRWPNGEAEAVGLVQVVVGILADDDCFDTGKGRVSGPCILLETQRTRCEVGLSTYHE